MGISHIIDKAIELAELGGTVFPPLATGAALAEKVIDLIDGLKSEAPDQQSEEELEVAHKALYAAMVAKGHALSSRLRGEAENE